MLAGLALLVGVLLLALLVLAVVQRMLRLALWLAIAALIVLGGWWVLREQAPIAVRQGVERAAADVATRGAKLADQAGREAAAIGSEVAREVGKRVAEEGERVLRGAMEGGDTDVPRRRAAGSDKP